MKKVDARSLSREAKAERRRMAIRLLEEGFNRQQVAEWMGVHPDTVGIWQRDYARRGEALFEASNNYGGRPQEISEVDQEWLVEAIRTKTPRDFGYASPLWSLAIARELLVVERKAEVHFSTVFRLLRRHNLRPRVPQRRAEERDDAEVDRFRQDTWKTVEAEAAIGATVIFADEANFRADGPVGTTWSPKGQRPVVTATGKRPRVQAISAVSWDGELYWETYTGSMNAVRFTAFLWMLLEVFPGRLVVVLDGLRVHFSWAVRTWIEENTAGRIRLVQLPAYSPTLNPDESVWSVVKGTLRRNPLRRGEDIEQRVAGSLEALAEAPERVRALFEHPDLAIPAPSQSGLPPTQTGHTADPARSTRRW